jgi:hypothetical protein
MESGQSAEYGDSGETEQDSARKNLAENSSVGPVEDVSEDFSQMERHRRNNWEINRGQNRIGEDKETGNSIDRTRGGKGYHRERKGTLWQMRIRFLGKSMPELFKELNEIFYDQPGSRH